MSYHYKYFNIEEREKLANFLAQGYSQTDIVKELGRNNTKPQLK